MKDLEVEILGSGGAVATPLALCSCAVCVEALEKGPPFSRCGPSYFIHGPNILIDTPEEIRLQLTRSHITEINACFYSHWHPDHVAGRRVWECNYDYRGGLKAKRATPLYLPERVAMDFKKWMGIWDNIQFLESRGLVKPIIMRDGESVTISDVTVTPFALAESYVYAFLIESKSGGRALIAPDELYGWRPPASLGKLDFAIIPTGLMEFNPFTGERVLPEGFPAQIREMTFNQLLEIIPELDTHRVFLSHIEEPDRLSYTKLCELEKILQQRGYPIYFAYDMQKIRWG
jgi:phosphoribosyl 1,2-cyclic phosphate phosphodiesterase